MWRGLPFGILPPPRLLLLGGVAATLVGIIRLELREGTPDKPPVPAQPLRQQPPPPPASVSHERPKHQDDGYLATILARPLFSPTRRPPSSAPAPQVAAPELARLSGIIVSPDGKSAIFAGTGGKPVAIGEGAHIGEYVVQSTGIDAVTLTGPEGKRTLHLAFDPKPPPPVQSVTPTSIVTPMPVLPKPVE